MFPLKHGRGISSVEAAQMAVVFPQRIAPERPLQLMERPFRTLCPCQSSPAVLSQPSFIPVDISGSPVIGQPVPVCFPVIIHHHIRKAHPCALQSRKMAVKVRKTRPQALPVLSLVHGAVGDEMGLYFGRFRRPHIAIGIQSGIIVPESRLGIPEYGAVHRPFIGRLGYVHRFPDFLKVVKGRIPQLSDGKLRETQTANYFSNPYPIDCAVPSVNA